MHFIYNIGIYASTWLVRAASLFSPKLKLFIVGRKNIFEIIASKIKPSNKTIWFHAASLGEYEQGLPLIEAIKIKYPEHLIVLTFFSPSGYEVKKNNTVADLTIYLPLDTPKNAKQFVQLINPEMAFFIKYEFWANYLLTLHNNKIPTYLVSGIFRKNQLFFKWYGGFYRKILNSFTAIFVQNKESQVLLAEIGISNVILSGDTRFDRVAQILKQDNKLPFIQEFKNNKTTIVIGSSWPKDEELIVKYINSNDSGLKFIIAPHNINKEQITQLKNSITKKTVLYSDYKNHELAHFDVFIIDTVGLLTRIYSEANIAYVGGGFGSSGVHNILEPATFGIPIVIGPNYTKFNEVKQLINLGGCISISEYNALANVFDSYLYSNELITDKGKICSNFISNHTGAVLKILNKISV
jgi:3-deoxy-D-manno-octulosonic-acid transferase